MDYLSKTFENFLILRDSNNEENDHEIGNFLDAYVSKILLKQQSVLNWIRILELLT